ncbi:nuclear transport factor 2 family protein [Brevundimonas aurifodinae]|uniref:Nuclear transport factor 2 family protein n=1 Tax=Brevundimonas aurifodinae TaxID=1508312 RepID=A0ABV1NJV0_9CAUL
MSRRLVLSAAVLLSVGPLIASVSPASAQIFAVAREAEEAANVVDAFHAALETGDTDSALALMSDDVMIFEEGAAERSRAEYASHHLEADAAYAAASESALSRRAGWASGDVAWIVSEGETQGQAGNSATGRLTVETMILKRGADGWRIQHIHWSSRAMPAA